MVMFTKDNGRMIKLTEKASIIIMMAPAIQANGFKIFNRDMVFKSGLMVLHIKGK